MSRSRNIKPGLWLNEELAELSIEARYLFPGLWCLADKDGRLEYRPKKIKAELYPYDNVDIQALAVELHGKKFISVYESEGILYIQINNFAKHQNPHPKEKSNGYPPPVNICDYDGNLKQFNFTARNVQIPFPSSSLIPSSLIPLRDTAKQKPAQKQFSPPTVQEVAAYCLERNNGIDPEYWVDSYTAKGWMVGKAKMKCWKATIRTWEKNGFQKKSGQTKTKHSINDEIQDIGAIINEQTRFNPYRDIETRNGSGNADKNRRALPE